MKRRKTGDNFFKHWQWNLYRSKFTIKRIQLQFLTLCWGIKVYIKKKINKIKYSGKESKVVRDVHVPSCIRRLIHYVLTICIRMLLCNYRVLPLILHNIQMRHYFMILSFTISWRLPTLCIGIIIDVQMLQLSVFSPQLRSVSVVARRFVLAFKMFTSRFTLHTIN